MKVKELVERLKCMNPNANIGIKTIDDVYVDELYLSYICKDANDNDISEKETKQVWIEAIDFCSICQFLEDNYCRAYDCDVSDVDECFQFNQD